MDKVEAQAKLREARLRLTEAREAKQAILRDVDAGALLDGAEVQRRWHGLATRLRTAFMQLPAAVADDATPERIRAEVRRLLCSAHKAGSPGA